MLHLKTYERTASGRGDASYHAANKSKGFGCGFSAITMNGNGLGCGYSHYQSNYTNIFDAIDLLIRLAAKQALTKP